ncbi:LPS assembly protein LptD [Blochmannia endosymbiont of Colobopsis nipponica]|uniref:LPS assembly protein LptD n=1 Tax=Blochmannia endosymbiont of Colobopsis nipponica TaxID=2681987 RepID=UPI00177B69BA|nr:LPS assembly protein LptD [Blochmannia endosymbiont of Colobopsis nipponica]QOI11278.1 LPS assembly protein LptD [Blochmannia endosymbiont of Colobopsis nipponica]
MKKLKSQNLNSLIRNFFLKLLINLIYITVYEEYTLAARPKKELQNITYHNKQPTTQNSKQIDIYIKANEIEYINHKQIQCIGNVIMKQDNSMLQANKIILNNNKKTNNEQLNTLTANGNIIYNNEKIKITGKTATLNINNKNLDIYQGTYQLTKQQANGYANCIMQRDNQRYTIIKNGNFSFCKNNKKYWNVKGSEIIYDHKKKTIDIWNAYFNLKNIPILYIPYSTFSINKINKAKITIPNFRYSDKKDFEFYLPYYLNINPYLQVNISPNYSKLNGIKMYTNLSYNGPPGINLIKFKIVQHKNQYNKKTRKYNIDYYQLHWKSNIRINEQLQFGGDYTKIKNYDFNFPERKTKNSNNHDLKKLWLNYNKQNLNVKISSKKFRSLTNPNKNIYQTLPQIEINIHKEKNQLTHFCVLNQITQFINLNNKRSKTIRLHSEPSIKIPIKNSFFPINSELKIKATYYQQKNNNFNYLKPNIFRLIPQLKIESKTTLYKNKKYYIQILKPHFQYLYVPYHNQKNIGIYDSSVNIPSSNYIELFRESPYNGPDRIPSMNKLINAASMHIYNKKEKKIFSSSIGQSYSFFQSRTEDKTIYSNKHKKNKNIIWINNNHINMSEKYSLIHNIQYNNYLNHVTLNETILEYKKDIKHIFQFSWNHANTQLLKKTFLNNNDKKFNNQNNNNPKVKIIGKWPLKKNLYLKSMYYYNSKNNHIESYLTSIKYTTHCWTLYFNYEYNENNYKKKIKDLNKKKCENKISFNIILHSYKKNNSTN